MRKIREVLRLKFEAGLGNSQIARAIGSARSTMQECLRRAKEAGVGWPLPEAFDEDALQARLYRRAVPLTRSPLPDFVNLQSELKRPGVTRLLLWQEYKAAHPDGWQYSVFCDQYRRWLATQDIVLRQHHTPGEKCFVDYAGANGGRCRSAHGRSAHGAGIHRRARPGLLKQLAKAELLVLDDFGLTPVSDQTKRDLLEILDDCYDRRSTIVTNQLPVDQWHTYLNDPTLADAILDRLVHNAYRLTLKGESMRKQKTVEAKTATRTQVR